VLPSAQTIRYLVKTAVEQMSRAVRHLSCRSGRCT